MSRTLRHLPACTVAAIVVLLVSASPANASDFGALATQAIFLFALILGASLFLAIATAAIAVWFYRRKWIWLMIPLFAFGWFMAIFGGWQLWLNRPRPAAVQEPIIPIPQADIPSPENR